MDLQNLITSTRNQLEQADSSQEVSTSRDVAPKTSEQDVKEKGDRLDQLTFLVADALFESRSVKSAQSIPSISRRFERNGNVISPTVCLVMLAHGSRDPRWCAPFERLKHELVQEMGPDKIRLAYLEFVGPTLMQVAARCVELNVLKLRLLPLFLAAGAHLATDVPRLVQEVLAKLPALEIETLPPVGEDPRIARLLKQMVSEAAADTQVAGEAVYEMQSLVRACA